MVSQRLAVAMLDTSVRKVDTSAIPECRLFNLSKGLIDTFITVLHFKYFCAKVDVKRQINVPKNEKKCLVTCAL